MVMNVIIIEPDGSYEYTSIDNDLESFQGIVGGLIENVYLGGNVVAVVNEEGLLLNLPFNKTASEICQRHIVGPVFFCSILAGDYFDVSKEFLNGVVYEKLTNGD